MYDKRGGLLSPNLSQKDFRNMVALYYIGSIHNLSYNSLQGRKCVWRWRKNIRNIVRGGGGSRRQDCNFSMQMFKTSQGHNSFDVLSEFVAYFFTDKRCMSLYRTGNVPYKGGLVYFVGK